MEKLNPKIIKIKAKILTPIHINNNEVLDRMDYFLISNDWGEIQVFNRKWLNFCAEKDRTLFNEIINNIELGNFLKVEELKVDFYDKYFDEFMEIYGVKEEIKVGEKAKNSLLQNREYENQRNQKGNQGEVKRFSRFGIDNEVCIPGSTLKGIFRTIFLNDEINKLEGNYKNKARILEDIDNQDDFKKDLFAFLQFEDVKINETFIEINQINSINKPKKQGEKSKKGPPQIVELLKQGEFEIIINDFKGQIEIIKLEKMIKDYSGYLIAREEKILDNIDYDEMFLNKLDEIYNTNIYPIKIGMFKKSLSYKLFWEEMIDDLNKNYSGEKWLKQSRKKGVGDKIIYIDESKIPLGWIGLTDIQILEN